MFICRTCLCYCRSHLPQYLDIFVAAICGSGALADLMKVIFGLMLHWWLSNHVENLDRLQMGPPEGYSLHR
jgi:hypothetical protein